MGILNTFVGSNREYGITHITLVILTRRLSSEEFDLNELEANTSTNAKIIEM